MKRFLVLICAVFLVGLPSVSFAKDVIDHAPFSALLKTYVSKSGDVRYSDLRANEKDLATLKAYVAAVGDAKVTGPKDAQLAFYLNAYNALVIDAILTAWPVESVMKVDGFFKTAKHKVAGKEMTLDDLEHKVVRPTFKDARVHFALNCAAKSCPPLKRKAFTEKNVNSMLEANTKSFLTKATSFDEKSATTSKLLEWFADDFKADAGSVPAYLAKYFPERATFLNAKETKIVFAEYDWALNGK